MRPRSARRFRKMNEVAAVTASWHKVGVTLRPKPETTHAHVQADKPRGCRCGNQRNVSQQDAATCTNAREPRAGGVSGTPGCVRPQQWTRGTDNELTKDNDRTMP